MENLKQVVAQQYLDFTWYKVYSGNIEQDLKNINSFRYYKDAVAKRMRFDEAYDIYRGVYLTFCKFTNRDSKVKSLFEDLMDWHRIDYAVKMVECYNNSMSRQVKRMMLMEEGE